MAIGLSNVETRKVKKASVKKSDEPKPLAKSRMASTLIENSARVMDTLSNETNAQPSAVRTAEPAPIKERKHKASSSAELNSLWLEWSNRVAGVEPESVTLLLARQWMEIERYVFDLVTENVLRELRKTAFGAKVVSKIEKRVARTRFSL
ncbi:MAG: hypothetical protein J0L82_09885 [Deltaproteobacteria bacterium]|nr:hypothetical protein [Deltaproteobacteria bacterium]